MSWLGSGDELRMETNEGGIHECIRRQECRSVAVGCECAVRDTCVYLVESREGNVDGLLVEAEAKDGTEDNVVGGVLLGKLEFIEPGVVDGPGA